MAWHIAGAYWAVSEFSSEASSLNEPETAISFVNAMVPLENASRLGLLAVPVFVAGVVLFFCGAASRDRCIADSAPGCIGTPKG